MAKRHPKMTHEESLREQRARAHYSSDGSVSYSSSRRRRRIPRPAAGSELGQKSADTCPAPCPVMTQAPPWAPSPSEASALAPRASTSSSWAHRSRAPDAAVAAGPLTLGATAELSPGVHAAPRRTPEDA